MRKALELLLRSNAVISEWIESPIRYRPDDPIANKLRALVDEVFDARALAHHYSSLGGNAAERWLDGNGEVPVKKYFYALRPALAIRALRLNPGSRPPMNLQALIASAALPDDVTRDIALLVEAKRRTNERANGTRMPRLDALIRSELVRAPELPMRDKAGDFVDRADTLFLELVNR